MAGMKTAIKIFTGLVMCIATAALLIYSSLPIFWEQEDPLQAHVYSITWRSGVMLILLLAITQGIAFVIFRHVRWPGSSSK